MMMPRCNTWTELDLKGFGWNLDLLRSALAGRADLILVVKADAYGHGMETVALSAFAAGVRRFMVVRIDEALALRAVLPEGEILLIGSVLPDDIERLLVSRIVPVFVAESSAVEVAAEARRRGASLPCHVKIDTGMGRLGVAWDQAVDVVRRLRDGGGLAIEGICTHFASAGQSGCRFDEVQADRFRQVEQGCRAMGMTGLFRHASNSSTFLSHPEWDMDGVRIGIAAYGYCDALVGTRIQTKPFLQWKTRVVQMKKVEAGFPVGYHSTYTTEGPTWLATVDMGYSDGYSRLMSNRGQVIVGGRRARVVGRVSMNFTVVDVGADGGVNVGDEVVLMGRQGGESLWADELAQWCQTIPYEILTSIRLHHRHARRLCP